MHNDFKETFSSSYYVNPFGVIFHNGKIISECDDGKGYALISVKKKDGSWKRMMKHRFVWLYHFGAPPTGMHIDHIDHNKKNNAITNLRLLSASEKSADCKSGTRKGARPMSSLQRQAIIELLENKWGSTSIVVVIETVYIARERHAKWKAEIRQSLLGVDEVDKREEE
jgi:hypothetical protein